jgi:alpha-beta hydrolase superfamily lysophospholipase
MFRTLIVFATLALATLSLPAAGQQPSPGEVVAFHAADGTELSGVWRGESDRVVILSHQAGITQDGWGPLVAGLEAAGYATFTYNFRGHPPSGGILNTDVLDDDLRGAIAFARSHGATQLTLIGASMGGIATAKVAPEVDPKAYVILAAPLSFGALRTSDEALQATNAAKLFINTERDNWNRATRHMAEVAAEPKALSLYPGSFHALLLFKTKVSEPLVEEIVTFVTANMPL